LESNRFDIDVVMSAYNAEDYILQSIESILNQTFSNFRFVIVNDCSSDRTLDIIKSFDDSRIFIIDNKKRLGLASSLNKAFAICKSRFIARMDADDISRYDRLEKQINFLRKNKDISIVGSYYHRINSKGSRLGFSVKKPSHNRDILWSLIFVNPFVHSSIMLRSSIFSSLCMYYDESFDTSQDYDLWSRSGEFFRFANINEPLLSLRIHKNAISVKKRGRQQINSSRVAISNISRFFKGLNIDNEEIQCMSAIFNSFDMINSPNYKKLDLIEKYLSMFHSFCFRNNKRPTSYQKKITCRNIFLIINGDFKILLKRGLFFRLLRIYPFGLFDYIIFFLKELLKYAFRRNFINR